MAAKLKDFVEKNGLRSFKAPHAYVPYFSSLDVPSLLKFGPDGLL